MVFCIEDAILIKSLYLSRSYWRNRIVTLDWHAASSYWGNARLTILFRHNCTSTLKTIRSRWIILLTDDWWMPGWLAIRHVHWWVFEALSWILSQKSAPKSKVINNINVLSCTRRSWSAATFRTLHWLFSAAHPDLSSSLDWWRSTVVRTSVYDRQTFPGLCHDMQLTGDFLGVNSPTWPTQPFIFLGSINE